MSKRKAIVPEPNIELLPEIWDLIWKQVPLLKWYHRYETEDIQVWDVYDQVISNCPINSPTRKAVASFIINMINNQEWTGLKGCRPKATDIIHYIQGEIAYDFFGPYHPSICRRASLKTFDFGDDTIDTFIDLTQD